MELKEKKRKKILVFALCCFMHFYAVCTPLRLAQCQKGQEHSSRWLENIIGPCRRASLLPFLLAFLLASFPLLLFPTLLHMDLYRPTCLQRYSLYTSPRSLIHLRCHNHLLFKGRTVVIEDWQRER